MENNSVLAFVGTYSDTRKDGVFGFRVGENGALVRTCSVNGGSDPTFLTLNSNGSYLYVANRPDDGGSIVSYAVDNETDTLSHVNATPTNGNGTPCYCSVDATDQCVLTAQYGGGTVSVLPIDEDGHVCKPTDVVKHEGSGPNKDRQSEPHPHCILPGPDNLYAYAPDLGADRVFVYELYPKAGTLEPADCGHVNIHPGAGPRHLTFHPNGEYAYLINELDSTIVGFERNAETGSLDPFATVPTLPDSFNGENLAADIHVHSSGDYLYGSNRGHNSIAIYELDSAGHPSLVEIESTRGEWPRNFALGPAGRFLFAENADTDTIVTFRIRDDGTLDPTGTVVEVPSPVCMQFVGG